MNLLEDEERKHEKIEASGSGHNNDERNHPASVHPDFEPEVSSNEFIAEEEEQEAEENPAPVEKKKRNSGRTGPTTQAGLLRSSRNALRHGCCASETLILDSESPEDWHQLLARWCRTYHIPLPANHSADDAPDSVEFDFVRKTARAEWDRLRCQRSYNLYFKIYLEGREADQWTPEEVKKHDLHLRYKTAAERTFLRENRALQQHLKFVQAQAKLAQEPVAAKKEDSAEEDFSDETMPTITIIGVDPNSPSGYRITSEIINGKETFNPRPFYPPDPLPAHWPTFYLPEQPPPAEPAVKPADISRSRVE